MKTRDVRATTTTARKKPCALTAVILLAASSSFSAATIRLAKTEQSCRQFASDFYNWYVPFANDDTLKAAASSEAIDKKPDVFEKELLRLLEDDREAQRKSKNGIVGIDWDPFLNGQDPAKHYVVGPAKLNGATCSVSVQSDAEKNLKRPRPDAIAQLRYQKGEWKFTNFLDPNSTDKNNDLVSHLKALAKMRNQSPHAK